MSTTSSPIEPSGSGTSTANSANKLRNRQQKSAKVSDIRAAQDASLRVTAKTSPSNETAKPVQLFYPTFAVPVRFPFSDFEVVIENLIRNPNITSSHLFRADVLYDSAKDIIAGCEAPGNAGQASALISQMKAELRPRALVIEGFELKRVLVREFVPRNPRRDARLVQSCGFYEGILRRQGSLEKHVAVEKFVVMLPHVEATSEIPWYHPRVKALGLLYQGSAIKSSSNDSEVSATISIHAIPFDSDDDKAFINALEQNTISIDHPDENIKRFSRTLTNLLTTIAKHGHGQLTGYTKRVHHDNIVPQSRFQDTYTRLKLSYAKDLVSDWRETTDPTKHVFEDLGIAAFCIELWRDMYGVVPLCERSSSNGALQPTFSTDDNKKSSKFQGFVDIGCGNGLLVHILLSEGYEGWGFDARARKSWQAYSPSTHNKLEARLLVPRILESSYSQSNHTTEEVNVSGLGSDAEVAITHDGVFKPGTFLISNHADELTPWTPLLAYLSHGSPFICIPCCSHDLTGARYRFPSKGSMASPQSVSEPFDREISIQPANKGGQAAETGSLARQPSRKDEVKPQVNKSAYATLCDYVAEMGTRLGFEMRKEWLRIPSTRNCAFVGRFGHHEEASESQKAEVARAVLKADLKSMSIEDIRRAWMEHGDRLRSIGSASH